MQLGQDAEETLATFKGVFGGTCSRLTSQTLGGCPLSCPIANDDYTRLRQLY
jgi:hypothetical protein